MPLTIQVDGKALIRVATPASGALEDLGYSINGVTIRENLFTADVHGDEFGGEQGPPIDKQYFGEMHVIQMTMTRYDEAVLNKIRAGVAGGTQGVPGTPGTLYFQEFKTWRLVINSTSRPRNYLNVVFHEPKEINKGTQHSKAIITATAYIVAAGGTLYNTTIV